MIQLKTISGNAASKSSVPALVRWVRTYRPDRIVITEAYRLGPWLEENLPGYERIQYGKTHGAEAPDVAVLARRETVDVQRRRLRKMTMPWWGPFTLRKRKARRLVVVVFVKYGVVIPTLGGHFPSGGASGGTRTRGRNKDAWMECATAVKRWMKRRPLAIATCDFNDNGHAVRNHCAPKGATWRKHSNVDGDLSKGCAAVHVRQLDDPDGMHGWAITTHTINEENHTP